MPYKTTRELHGLLTEWWGHSTNAEMVQMQEQVHSHPDFNSVCYSIHDFSNCESFAPDDNDVEFSAAIDKAASITSKRLKIAIVAPNAGVSEMVNQYINVGFSPYPVRMFSTLKEAREWSLLTEISGS